MGTTIQDLRYAVRQLRRSPVFTLAAVGTLALGVGANAAIFSVIKAVLLAPLPYPDADRLVGVWTHPDGRPEDQNPASLPELEDWRRDNTVFAQLAGYAFNRFELNGPEGTDLARAAMGTPDFFNVIGTAPFLGRTLTPADERLPLLLLSHRLWLRRYGADPSVIGKTVNLYDAAYTIVGVMPPGFHFPTPDIDLWTSLAPMYGFGSTGGENQWITSRSLRAYRVVARLRPGVSAVAAEAAMNRLQRHLAETYPADEAGTGIRLESVSQATVGGVRRALWTLFGAAAFVLLIGCANIAHLLLARTSSRAREIAIRQALGAGRWRLVRQMLTESLLLGMAGGLVGLLVAEWATTILVRISPGDIPRLETVTVDHWVLAFLAVVSLGAGLLFGLAPAREAWRGSGPLIGGARGIGAQARGSRFRRALVTAEVALALVLSIGAALMLRSFGRLVATNPGFPTDHLLAFHVTLALKHYPEPQQQLAFAEQLLERIRSLPGTQAAGGSTSLPPTFAQQSSDFSIEGRPTPPAGQGPQALLLPSTPAYLQALGVPLLAGREFDATDRADAPPVAVINRRLAQEFFPGESPLGKRLVMDGVSRTIVGIAGDVAFEGLGVPIGPQVYVPFAQSPFGGMWIAVRTHGDPASVAGPVRAAIAALDRDMHAARLSTMEDLLADSVVRPRFQALLLGGFGSIAFLLAGLGIYGVIGYGVTQRTGEIGLRLALGAPRRRVLAHLIRQGMAPVLAGLVLGLGAALLLSHTIGSLLYEIAPTDPQTFAGVTLFLGLVALLAAFLPARRASRLDPMLALRVE